MSDRLTVIHADCVEGLRTLADESVQLIVTSPPYYALRDYKIPPNIWGGDPNCEHSFEDVRTRRENRRGLGLADSPASTRGGAKKIATVGWQDFVSGFCSKCSAWRGCFGLEPTLDLYIEHAVLIFREARRVLRDDGTLWINLGDSFANDTKWGGITGGKHAAGLHGESVGRLKRKTGFKAGDLMGMPWRVAFALQADGWYLRRDNIWCLSGGTWLYVRTQKGDMPMMLRDAARLDPSTVQLWNSNRWTQVLGWSRTSRTADELEIVLRSGERISCTPEHRFPTKRGLLKAGELSVGDVMRRCVLPEPDAPRAPRHITADAAWFAGLYIAEGSRSDDCIQISGHASQTDRLETVKSIAQSYGGTATVSVDGNKQGIRVYSKLLCAVLRELVSGKTAKDKCLSALCWRYDNNFLRAVLDGYLSGDAHYDSDNQRWRLGFTRNYNLERDLRTLAARLGFKIKIKPCFVDGFGRRWPAFKGEIRFTESAHGNVKPSEEIVAIRRARCREVYDVGVGDEPHLFALASGILTHNSKPNPMPESVDGWRWEKHRLKVKAQRRGKQGSVGNSKRSRDMSNGQYLGSAEYVDCPGCAKCSPNDGLVLRKANWRTTTSHEYVFQFSKTDDYFCDAQPVRETKALSTQREKRGNADGRRRARGYPKTRPSAGGTVLGGPGGGRNLRSVWRIPTKPFRGAHFATFPPGLVRPIIAAASPVKCCIACDAPWAPVVARGKPRADQQRACGGDRNGNYNGTATKEFALHGAQDASAVKARILAGMVEKVVTGYRPTCLCGVEGSKRPVVLDMFGGSGTVGEVANELGRDAILIEISSEYIPLIERRCHVTPPLAMN